MPDHTDPDWLREAYKTMTQREMAEVTGVTPQAIGYHMDKHNIKVGPTKSRVKEDVLRVSNDLDRAPSQREYDKLGNYGHSTVIDMYDNKAWNDILLTIGLEPLLLRDISKDDLREDVIRVSDKLGRPPGIYEYDEVGQYSYMTVNNKLGDGSWPDTLKSVDLWPIEYGGVAMRSSYEPTVAQRLDELDIPWEYEPEQLQTEAGGYTPDFVLDDGTIIEVKGMPRENGKAPKLKELMKDRRVVVVGTEWWRGRLPCDDFFLYDEIEEAMLLG